MQLMEDSLNSNGIANTVVVSEDSEFWNFENPHLPGRGRLDWTVDRKCFYLDGLHDYQRIVPTRAVSTKLCLCFITRYVKHCCCSSMIDLLCYC